jgi:hypothetical protein
VALDRSFRIALKSAAGVKCSCEQCEGADFTADEAASLTGLPGVSKVVFSSTLHAPLAWPNTELVSGDPVEAVAEMKTLGDGHSRTFDGCLQLLEYVPTLLTGTQD